MRRGTRRLPIMVGVLVVLTSLPFAAPVFAAGTVSLTTIGSAYTQDFNSLANVQGSSTNATLPTGWALTETGGATRDNELYGADNGFGNAGDTYSYGSSAATDRAFGSLRSSTLVPVIGASFTNNTGATVGALQISYFGEMWRSGVLNRGAADRMDFQLSTDATDLATGSWTDYDGLDYSSTVISSGVNAHDGNDSGFRTNVSSTISGLSIANGATFWLRWNDMDISSSDDGLAVDDFSLTPLVQDAAPQISVTSPADSATGVPVGSDITLTFSEPVNVTGTWFTMSCGASGAHTATVSGGPTTFTLNPDSDFNQLETCTVTVIAAQVTDQDSSDPPDNMAANHAFSFQTEGNVCTLSYTHIYSIQGSGTTPALTGTQTTQGVVVGDFEGPTSAGLQGVFIQDVSGDGDAATSDGLFVFRGNTDIGLDVGDLVRVTGNISEFNAQTQLTATAAGSLIECGTAAVPAVIDINLPQATSTELERYEGMRVRFPQALVISEYFEYEQFGEVVLAQPVAGEDRLFTPTHLFEPGSAAQAARQSLNQRSQVRLNDGLANSNPGVLRHPDGTVFSLTHYFRGGDTVANAVGILGERTSATNPFPRYRIEPTGPATYTEVNPRPTAPDDTDGRVTVAAQNTLNFFLTLDTTTSDSGPGPCGGLQNLDCRGADADQSEEFSRQRRKLLATLAGINADVIGLNEIENTPNVNVLGDATKGIVPGLNEILGPGTYAYIDTGVIGTDAIRVGMIYKPGVVTPVGDFEILNSSDDPRFLDNKSRPVLAQTFEENATGSRFTVAVNHLKSKGSSCSDVGDLEDPNGQGNCNVTRTNAAKALVDWLATDPTNSLDPDFLIVGDLNSYAMEDPIDAIKAGRDDTAGTSDDYTNLVNQFLGTYAYSYVFDAQNGYLDHALSSSTLTSQVTGVVEWHNNADEADVFDYDTTFKPNTVDALYEPLPYRASDHDSIIVGLDLDVAPVITSLTGPSGAVKAGTSAGFSASWTDANTDDTFTTTWDWGDSSADTVHSSATSPDAASHTYAAAGFYTVTFTVTDSTGLSDSGSLLVVVYDPAAGKVNGSGTYAGGGSFSLSAKYNPAGTAISGTSSFSAPGVTFVTGSVDWLVVSGNRGTYSGTGTYNGSAGYRYLIAVSDGGTPGSKDRVRFQVSDSAGNVVYDTQPGAPIDAAPTTTPTSGNVTVHV